MTKEEFFDIKETCAEMDTYLQKSNEDINYQSLYNLFQTCEGSFVEFKFQLGNRLDKLQFRDSICKRLFIKDQELGAYYQKTLLAVDKWCNTEWKNLTPEKQNDLIISITDGVFCFVMLSDKADGEFQILKDKIVLKKLVKFDTICFKNKQKEVGRVELKQMIDLIRTEFTNILRAAVYYKQHYLT